MGQYFHMVCHTCRQSYYPTGGRKLAEIELNLATAMLIGHFACEHAGHLLELRGDEWTHLFEYDEDGYVIVELSEDGYAADARKAKEFKDLMQPPTRSPAR